MLAALAEVKRDPSALAPLEVGAYGLALRLLTPHDVTDGALIERLGAWRAASMANYPTQFPVTAEGTARWLREHVLGDADRLMFLIVDADDPYGVAYGHMGFDHAHPSEPVLGLSNVLKGDRERLPRGAMEVVEERMIAWAHEALGVVQITAEIFEDNRPSCALHERLGFVQTGRRGLRRHVEGDRTVYRPLAEDDEAEPDRWWIRVVRAERSPRGRGSVASTRPEGETRSAERPPA
jgi:RimJ/RimL family protein N-acetyltransferase